MSARGTINTRDCRSTTGCVGISLVRTVNGKRDGRVRLFFAAHAGGTNRKFCIDTLGRSEAFRRAISFRAAYEISVRKEAARAC